MRMQPPTVRPGADALAVAHYRIVATNAEFDAAEEEVASAGPLELNFPDGEDDSSRTATVDGYIQIREQARIGREFIGSVQL